MTVPRELMLVERNGRLHLAQRPVRELERLRRHEVSLQRQPIAGEAPLAEIAALGGAAEYELAFAPPRSGEVGLVLRYGEVSAVRIGYDAANAHVFVDRSQGGAFDEDDSFRARHYAPAELDGGVVRLHILLDHSSVEVFADDGLRVISDLIFPEGPLSSVALYATGEAAELTSMQAWRIAAMERGAD